MASARDLGFADENDPEYLAWLRASGGGAAPAPIPDPAAPPVLALNSFPAGGDRAPTWGPAGGPPTLPPPAAAVPGPGPVGPDRWMTGATPPTPPDPSPTVATARPQLQKTATTTQQAVATKNEGALEKNLALARGREQTAAETAADTTAEQQIARDIGGIKEKNAAAEKWRADEAARIEKEAQAERARAKAERDAAVANAQATSAAEYQRYAAMKPADFWDDKSTGKKASILLGLALGGLGAAISGQGDRPSLAKQALDKEVDRFDKNERQKIELQRQKWVDSGVPLAQAEKQRDAALVDLEHKKAGLLGAMRAEAEAKLAENGGATAKVETDLTVQKLRKDEEIQKAKAASAATGYVEQDLAREVGKRAQVTSTHTLVDPELAKGGAARGGAGYVSEVTGKPASNDERQADSFAERMANQLAATKNLPPLSAKGRQAIRNYLVEQKRAEASPTVNYLATLGGLRTTLESRLSDTDRAHWQALNEFTSANLRRESGAAISAGEMSAAFDRFAPVTGDKGQDAARKRKAQEDVAMGAARSSYRPSHWEQQIKGGGPQAPGAGGGQGGQMQGRQVQVRNKRTGAVETAYQLPDGRLVRAGEMTASR